VRLLLFNPRAQRAHRRLPLSLLHLARGIPAEVDGEPVRWEILDANVEPEAKERAERAIAEDPAGTVLFLTVMPGPQLLQAVPWCRHLKALWPALRIVWGGYFPTVHAAACLADPIVDAVVLGQGEATVAELVPALARGQDPTGIAGVQTRGGSGPQRKLSPSFRFGEAPFQVLDMERYAARTFLGRRTYNHHSSVGCPYTCNFCAVTNMFEGRWLADPAESVVGTVQLLHRRYGADAIEFHDNNFFAAERRCVEVARGIAPWACAGGARAASTRCCAGASRAGRSWPAAGWRWSSTGPRAPTRRAWRR
jgi:anaerobic magnesium-protoporphyrin IX monomethyl ester cyclase